MTAEELIIGHYEKTLTTEQESNLAAMVAGSPDVRGLFEQHGNIHGLMVEDAGNVQTSSKLDKVVIGAALGTLAEIAGHGIGFSLLGKVASVIGAIAVGGVGVVMYNNMTDDDNAELKSKPAVQQTVTPSDAAVSPAVVEGTESPAAVETPAATTNTTERPSQPSGSVDATDRSRAASARTVTAEKPKVPAASRPGIELNPKSPDATIKDTNVKTRPGGNK